MIATDRVIHRAIEHQAAICPDLPALIDGLRTVTYRELNARANVIARYLMGAGLRRSQRALIRMDRGTDLAVVLLAVLKCGAAYAWIDAAFGDADLPQGVMLTKDSPGEEQRYHLIDLRRALGEPVRYATPNLPVLTREGDIACVVPARDGSPALLIPHGSIGAIPVMASERSHWVVDPAAFDLWVALAAGATVTLTTDGARVAA